MATKLFNLIALATLAILAASNGPSQVNALSVESHNFVRHHARHDLIAKRQQDQPKSSSRRRCKARPSSSLVVAPSSRPAVSSAASSPVAKPSQQPQPQPQQPAPPAVPAPAPASSSKPAAPAPSNGNNGNGNNGGNTGSNGTRKVGIAWANDDEQNLANFLTAKVSAVYTWSPWKPAVLKNRPDVEFLPMLWGVKQIDQFKRLVVPGYARTALGFNEPDQGGQANINPGYAADLWRQHLQPLKSQGYRLVSPAPTNAPAGLQWLRDFMNACSGCSVDVIATHWYGTSSQNFIDHVTNYHNAFGREVWVTEFACQNFGGGAQCSEDQIWQFMRTVTDWMDRTSFVGKYFAFGVLHNMGNVNWANQLMNSRGQPTALGYEYLS